MERRLLSFWPLQIGGWLLYAVAIAAASIPFRHSRDFVAYRTAFLLAGFAESFAMYGLCHTLWRKKIPLFRSLLLCASLAYVLGTACSAASIWAEAYFGGSNVRLRWASIFAGSTGGSFVLIAWGAFYFGIKHYQALEEQKVRLLASEAMARDAQLQSLRYQLQPHFLFNILNAISSLVVSKQSELAAEMIARLGGLLRNTLSLPDTHSLTLKEELAVVEEYLSIEKVRFGPRLAVWFDVTREAHDAQVPRFLLQPLIENAIRHGIASRPEGGSVEIRASVVEGWVQIEIENNRSEFGDQASSDVQGVGLANTRARLEKLYGTKGSVTTITSIPGRFSVSLRIPFIMDSLSRTYEAAR
jgi:Histidine kinase